ncbi:apolipoprotein D [Anabrus simplex]|uniref:apolipoprotein D n=1 Tax=Anabrus simplex TaxID=316456 RepID=UPI0035A3AE9D
MPAASGLVVVVLAALHTVAGHSYHKGQCRSVQPMHEFDMDKFLGRWYVLQKTSTKVRCLVNEFSPGRLQQTMIFGIPGVNNVVRYQGELTVPDPTVSAEMKVDFPLNIAGTSSYIVFDTDYTTYAGVYSCQKLALWYRHSASILSRTPTLDPAIIQRLRQRLDYFGVSSRGLDTIQQTCTGFPEDGIEVNIKSKVFKPSSAAEMLATGRDVINEVAGIARDVINVYNEVHKVTGKRKRRDTEDSEEPPGEPVWIP